MHMAIGSKSNVKLVYVGWSDAIQDFLLVPYCTGVLSNSVLCFPLHFSVRESNVIEIACWILVEAWVCANVHAFTSLITSSGIFSKVTQQQGANYLTIFCKKSVQDHNAQARASVT